MVFDVQAEALGKENHMNQNWYEAEPRNSNSYYNVCMAQDVSKRCLPEKCNCMDPPPKVHARFLLKQADTRVSLLQKNQRGCWNW